MRIVGGKHSGYKFHPPKNNPARPTTDIAKEGLFNVLDNTFELSEIRILDLFGGTGSISYEFASRGCPDITIVERYIPNVKFIKSTAAKLDLPIKVFAMDVFKFIESSTENFAIIFAGPPYPIKEIPLLPDLIFKNELIKRGGWLVLEHNPDHDFTEHKQFLKSKKYGTTIFSIFEMEEAESIQ